MKERIRRKRFLRRFWHLLTGSVITPIKRLFRQADSSPSSFEPPSDTTAEPAVSQGSQRRAHQGLITPVERILDLVSQNGGRLKQQDIVSMTEWSESTVSRKLTQLESTGHITRYPIGREKMVYLPGREPASLDSPFAHIDEQSPTAIPAIEGTSRRE